MCARRNMRPGDLMVGEAMIYDAATNTYAAPHDVCSVNTEALGIERRVVPEKSDQPLRLYFGRPGLSQDLILYNFFIE